MENVSVEVNIKIPDMCDTLNWIKHTEGWMEDKVQ